MWKFDLRFEGEIVVLEPIEHRHGDGLLAAGQNEEIWTWWPLNPAESRESMDEFVETSLAAAEADERQHYATLDAQTATVIGSTSYCLIQPENRVVEIGWTFLTNPVRVRRPPPNTAWGGVGTETKGRARVATGCQPSAG